MAAAGPKSTIQTLQDSYYPNEVLVNWGCLQNLRCLLLQWVAIFSAIVQ
jgi:hypothetical protein